MIAVVLILIMKPGPVSAAWSVTFKNPDPCALKGASVEFRCSYSYPETENVLKTSWYKGCMKDGHWKRVDLSVLPSYQNRSEYLGDQQHSCGLALHNLQDNDTGHYYFGLETDKYIRQSQDSVFLSVTELNVRVSPQRVRMGDNVKLECGMSCEPAPSTVWLKDTQPITNTEFQAQADDAGTYVCVVEGLESVNSHSVTLDVQYSPLNVSVEVTPPGLLAVGSSVNLTCSSAANPVADNYTWYRATASTSITQVGSGPVLSFPSMEESHNGVYVCQAGNHLGENNSTEVLLTVGRTDIYKSILIGIGVTVLLLLLLPLVIIWIWKHYRKSADTEEHSHDYENVSASHDYENVTTS
ncbi:B-cell receptor CD22 isoform X2 [Parambassis ranga]|uniref:B-cell receptor CD22 isoform X2 n=1 Tax=Parambassis ranga TaxID=210632 RepID=A0A6P7JWH0_9TELE|nr:B-cell receptor CD22-like isoform X2 [Parambassis ranga]